MLPASCWFLAWRSLRPSEWRRYVPPNCWLAFNDLHGIIFQKTELFIVTAVTTPDVTRIRRVTLRLTVYANQFVLVTSPLRLTTSNSFFQPNTCGRSPYVTSSVTRGWVCRLQLLVVLASTVILRSESRGTHDHILLSQIRDSLNPVFISPRNKVARLYPQALGSLFVASYDSQGYGGDIRTRLLYPCECVSLTRIQNFAK
jgi:hypothetical protein